VPVSVGRWSAVAYSARAFPQPGYTQGTSRRAAGPPGGPAGLSDRQLTDRLAGPLVKCASGSTHPDVWFPHAQAPARARAEAAAALALCVQCLLRAECLEVSMRQWATVGRHGIWGGLVEAERAALYPAWRAGVPASALLQSAPPCAAGRGRPAKPQPARQPECQHECGNEPITSQGRVPRDWRPAGMRRPGRGRLETRDRLDRAGREQVLAAAEEAGGLITMAAALLAEGAHPGRMS